MSRFAGLAAENLNISEPILQSLGEPVRVKETVVDGEPSGLAPYLVAVAVTLSLMFVALLLAAGAPMVVVLGVAAALTSSSPPTGRWSSSPSASTPGSTASR